MIVFQIATHHKLPTPSRKILESTPKLLLLNHTSHCGASTPTILPSTRSICVKQYFAPNSQHTSHVSDGVPLQRDGRSQPCWWDDAGIVSVIPRVKEVQVKIKWLEAVWWHFPLSIRGASHGRVPNCQPSCTQESPARTTRRSCEEMPMEEHPPPLSSTSPNVRYLYDSIF
jgi:hypothetical protein